MLLISGVEHNGWFREVPSCELPKYLCTFWSCKFQKKKGRSDFIVAFVDAPAGDQKLQLLPDHLFLENGKRVFIGVEGRDPQQRGFIPVGTPSPPPPPPPPARPSVASEPPASTRDREDPARGGVAILVRPGLAIVDPTVAFKDINGRLLMVKFSSEAGHPWAVLGVYDPVEPADRAGFYTTQLREAAEARPSGSSLLMAGDFNCVTSQLDVQTQQANPAQNSRLIGGDSLQAVQAEQGLTDGPRLNNSPACGTSCG